MNKTIFSGVVLIACIFVSGCASYRSTLLNQTGTFSEAPFKMKGLKMRVVSVEGDSYRKPELIQALKAAKIFKEIGEPSDLTGRPDLILTIAKDNTAADFAGGMSQLLGGLVQAVQRPPLFPYVIPTKRITREHFKFTLSNFRRDEETGISIDCEVTDVQGWIAPLLNLLGGSISRTNALSRSLRSAINFHSDEIQSLLS